MLKGEYTGASPVLVRDTRDILFDPPFEVFREAVINAALPYRLEESQEAHFSARVEKITFDEGNLARVRALPHVAERSDRHIARSAVEGYLIVYMLAGQLAVEQSDVRKVAQQGDLVVFDTRRPSKMIYPAGSTGQRSLSIFAPLYKFSNARGLQTFVLSAEQIIKPLTTELSFISENFLDASRDELAALYDASLPLISLAAGRCEQPRKTPSITLRSQYLFEELLDFIHRNIGNGELSARYVANAFGISDRYLHKLFAKNGTSFGSYLSSKRLDKIATELTSPKIRFEAISSLAYQCGFNDISTFNKLFKRKFGCSPKAYRLL